MGKANNWTPALLRKLQSTWNSENLSLEEIVKQLGVELKPVSLAAMVSQLRKQGYYFRSRVKVREALTFAEIVAKANLVRSTDEQSQQNMQTKKRVKQDPPEKNVELAAHLNAPQPEVVLNAKGQPQKNVYRVSNIDAMPKHRLADHPASPRELEALDFG